MTISDVIKNLNLPENNLSSRQAEQILKVLAEQKQVNETTLRDLVNRVSTTGQGEITVLYSGSNYKGIKAAEIARDITENHSDVRMIGNTEAARFLESNELRNATVQVFGETVDDLGNRNSKSYKFISDANGLWGDVSANFIRDTKGIVTGVIFDNADPNRIFAQREIPELLKNKNIDSIFGLSAEHVAKLDLDNTKAFNFLMNQSGLLMKTTNLQMIQGEVHGMKDFLHISTDLNDYFQKYPQNIQYAAEYMKHLPDDVVNDFMKYSDEFNTKDVNSDGNKHLSKFIKGAVLLGFLLMAKDAVAAEQAGEHEKAKSIVEDWAIEGLGGFIGGEIGAVLGGIAIGALTTAGVTVSAPVTGVVILGAALTGGIFGAEGTTMLHQYFKNRDIEEQKKLFKQITELLYESKDFTILDKTTAITSGNFYSLANHKDNKPASLPIIIDKAMSDLSWRFAVKNLNPFVIENIDYSRFNKNGELELFSQDNPNGMTDEFIKARASMLMWKIQYLQRGLDFDERFNILGLPTPVSGDYIYEDLESSLRLDIDGLNPTELANHHYIFGYEKNDLIQGDRLGDKLFGGTGNDKIYGLEGDDYLEGGVGKDTLEGGNGFDTYFADNNDTISDSDGKGAVLLNNVKLVGGVQDLTGKDKDLYYSEDGSIKYRWNKETKELTVNDGLVIKDFDNEELGINLVEAKGQDIAFVVDVSGSMGDDINAVVKQLDGLLNMIFSPKRGMMDSRISVVAYEEPITVLQKFTQHDTVAERKAAAKQAIAKLPNMIGGGTEYLYTALYTVLSGGAGEWRKDAKARHIFLIGDEPGDDAHLAKQVYALAKNLNINANVTSRSSEGGKFYDVRFQNPDSDDVMSVNIHPIMIGNNTQLSEIFNDIAQQTGGNVHQTQGASDIADILYDALQSGTAGDDVQIGNEANNTFNGRAGNDKLFGEAGNDTLNGGVGNDTLDGGEGADKFVFSRYFGQDVVYSDELDTFVFNDISLNNLKFIQAANHDLLIQQQGTQNQVTVTGFFDGGSSFAVLQDDFGNTLSAEQVMEMAQPVAAIDKNQTITGNNFANQLFGGSGDDVLKGLLGNDVLNGGLGNDRLEGGLGADTYVFKAGDGHDRLYDSGGNDTLRFEDVGLDRLWFSRDGKNLQIDVLDGGGSVKIENYFTSAKSTHFTTNAIEHFQADGHHLFAIRVNRLLDIMDKFKPTEHSDWNVDMQKQHYLQNNHIEQYWQAIEQY